MNITKITAEIVSAVLQPLFIPTYGTLLLTATDPFFFSWSAMQIASLNFIVFISTALVPALIVALGRITGHISDTYIYHRNQRHIPYLLTIVSYTGGIIILHRLGLNIVFTAPLIASTINLILITIINIRWKISAHLAGLGGFAGAVVAYSLIFSTPYIMLIVASILLGGAVGWSRMYLKAHTLGQVLCGWFLAFTVMIITWTSAVLYFLNL